MAMVWWALPTFCSLLAYLGQARGDGTYQARYDLDGDGAIGFSDFLILYQ